MNQLLVSKTQHSAPIVLTALCLALTLLGCQQEKSTRATAPTGLSAAPATPASETAKKIQDLDNAIAQTKSNPSISASEKQTAISAMERGKATLQAKTN